MTQSNNSASPALSDYIAVVRLRWSLVLVVVLACTAAAYVFSVLQAPVYSATAYLMYVPPVNITNSLGTSSSTDVNSITLEIQSVTNTIGSPAIGKEASSLLEQSFGEAKDYTVKATIQSPDSSSGATVSDVVAITAGSSQPRLSAVVANAYTEAVINTRIEDEGERLRAAQEAIQAQMAQFSTQESKLSTDYLLLAQRLRDLQVAEATATGDFKVIGPAVPPESPSSPKPFRAAVTGLGVGLFAGIALAFLVAQFDTRVRSHRQVTELLDMRLIGRVPRVPRGTLRDGELVTLTDPAGPAAESMRMLRSNLGWLAIDGDWKSVLVTSGRQGEGKTLTLCNLAVALALGGKKVLVVDADLRAPRVHVAFSLPNARGLTSVLRGSASIEDVLRPISLGEAGSAQVRTALDDVSPGPSSEGAMLRVLTSGPTPPNPGEVVASRRLGEIIGTLMSWDVDYVLVDAPPILVVGDAGALANSVDGLLFVVNLDEAKRSLLEDCRETLDAFPCEKLGVVVVGGRSESQGYYYGQRTSS